MGCVARGRVVVYCVLDALVRRSASLGLWYLGFAVSDRRLRSEGMSDVVIGV